MARITIDNVKNTMGVNETYDIVNAIRNSGSPQMQQYVPLASAENIAQVGAGLQLNQTVQNEFITSLVDRIGLVVITQTHLSNPLKKFKKGQMPYGRTIEQIFVDITRAQQYDPEDAEETVFKREIPNVKTLFHERNRQERYKQTIQDSSLKTAFISWGNFESFLSSIITAIYNSAEVDEFKYTKLLIDNYQAKGHFTQVRVPHPDSTARAQEFVKIARATYRKMTLPFGSREYNALGVHTRTEPEDVHIIIDADLEAELDVDVLAKAFNMDKTTFMGNITVIDGFASEGLEAVIVDKDWFMIYDNLLKMETIRNPQGLYWNYNYHVWQTFSASRFHNAVALVSGDVQPISQVILEPALLEMKAGREHDYRLYVRKPYTNDVEYTITYEVTADLGSTLETGTAITQDPDDPTKAKLVTADNQEGQLIVTATLKYTEDAGLEEGEPVEHTLKGESVVTVSPKVN